MLNTRLVAGAAVLGLVGSVLLTTAATSAAAPVPLCDVFFDIDKDKHDDLVVGTPGEDVGRATDAGTVTVAYGDSTGTFGPFDGRSISEADLGYTSQPGDRFGAVVLTADLNGDKCGDLVIGAPGKSSGAGAVYVVYGKAPGTTGSQFGDSVQVLRQGANGVSGKAEAGDGFGSSLAVTGSGANGPTQLWVGVPGEDIGKTKNAGLVQVFRTATTVGGVLPTTGITSRQQGSGGFSGGPEAGDAFGSSLAGSATTVLVGAPGEGVGSRKSAGMFYAVVAGVPAGYTENSTGIPGGVEAGDRFGSRLAVWPGCQPGTEAWAIGTPLENVGSVVDAGAVAVLDRGTRTALLLQQGLNGLPGGAEKGDLFGSALVGTGRAGGRTPSLAIGAPGENLSAGTVTTLSVTCAGTVLSASSVKTWSQNTGVIPDSTQSGDRFGAALGASLVLEGPVAGNVLDYRLVIGAPGEDESTQDGPLINSGIVTVLPAAPGGFTDIGSEAFGQSTALMPGVGETSDGFGSALDSANASR
ncbi:MAG TPA: FG-GAP repeat protein [Candidatus Limnocylindria bacterium]|nr:FG-GAP repeat protein [Candidatus Limnocylindria bacterium]